MKMDLSKLSEPFPSEDIEWRVSRSGRGERGIYCAVLAYVTNRAIQKRLDNVCGIENWQLKSPLSLDVNGKSAFAVGISIRIGDEWITKWDVAEPTNVEPAKGAFSSAMKRAGSQWSIARYLYHLDETYATVATKKPDGSRQWNYAKLAKPIGGDKFYWKTPSLPSWALPKEPEHEINVDQLACLKQEWRSTFAADVKNPKDLLDGFTRFVVGVAGEFPSGDHTCWTQDMLDQCSDHIEKTTDPNGVSADVPFEE